MSEAEVAPPRGAKPSRWPKALGRWWIVGPLVLLVLLVVAVLALPLLISPDFLRRQVVSALTDLGLDVEIGGLDYHPLSGVELADVRLKAPPGYSRDPLTAGRVAVRYSLWPLVTGEAVVRTVTLEDAHVVFETRDGRSNIDALLARMDERAGTATTAPAPAAPPPPPSSDGPPSSLTPVAVRVDDLRLGPLTVEVAGEGPNAKLTDVWVKGVARLGTRALTASVALTVEPGDERNLTFRIPQAGGATAGALTAKLRAPIAATADTSAGFRLGRSAVKLDLGVFGTIERPAGPLPPVDLVAGLDVRATPDRGEAAVPRLRVALDGRPLVDASAEARGLWTLLHQALAPAAADGLATTLGLRADDAPDRLEAQVALLRLPLDELAPVARALVPGVASIGGRAQAEGLGVAGGLAALVRGQPPVLTGALRVDAVRCDWPGVLTLAALDGQLTADRRDAADYAARGRFDLRGLAVAGQRVAEATLTLAAAVDRLDIATGATTATVTLNVADLDTPPLSAKTAGAAVVLRGEDPLQAQRAVTAPVAVRATVRGERLRVAGADLAIRNAELSASLRADRLLDAARAPWAVRIDADVRGFAMPAVRFKTGTVVIDGTLGDVRAPGYDAALALDARFRRFASAGAAVDRLTLKGRLAADDVRSRRLAGAAGETTAPRRIGVKLAARARSATYRGLRTPVAVSVDGDMDLAGGAVVVRRAGLQLGPEARLSVSGRLARLFTGRPAGRAKVRLALSDLRRTWARIPAAFRGGVDDLELAGGLRADLDLRGRWPSPWPARIDWRRPPVQADISVGARDVMAVSASQGFALRAFTGTVAAALAPDVALVSMTLGAGSARYGSLARVRGFRWQSSVGLDEGTWRATAEARAAEVATELEGRRTADAASLQLSALYVPRGDLSIERLDARLPAAGLGLGARGRLRRGPDGAMVPELTVDAEMDLEPLAGWVPALRAGAGRVGAQLSLDPGPSSTLVATGRARGGDGAAGGR